MTDSQRLQSTAAKVLRQFHANITYLILDECNSEPEFRERLRDLISTMAESKPELGGFMLQPVNIERYSLLLYKKYANLEVGNEFEEGLAALSLGFKPSGNPDRDAYKETLLGFVKTECIEKEQLIALADMRKTKNISEAEHFAILTELDISKERFTQMVRNGNASPAEKAIQKAALEKQAADRLAAEKRAAEERARVSKAVEKERVAAVEKERSAAAASGIAAASYAPPSSGKLRNLAKQFEAGQIKNASNNLVADTSADEALARQMRMEMGRQEEDWERLANERLIAQLNSDNLNYQEAKRLEAETEALNAALAQRLKEEDEQAVKSRQNGDFEAARLARQLAAEEEARLRAQALARQESDRQGAQLAARLMAQAEEEERATAARKRAQVEQDAATARRRAEEEAARRRAEDEAARKRTEDDLAAARRLAASQSPPPAASPAAASPAWDAPPPAYAPPSYSPPAAAPNNNFRYVKEYWTVIAPSGLRVRSSPSADGTALGVLNKGTIVASQVRQDNWIKHSTGWSMYESDGRALAQLISPDAFPRYEVLSTLRIREAPSPSATELGVLNEGQTVLGLKTEGHWLQHELGWSMMHTDPAQRGEKKVFLQPATHLLSAPVPVRRSSSNGRNEVEQFEVLSPLRVRETPSPDGKEAGILQPGSRVNGLEIKGLWLRHDLGWSMIHSDPSKGEKKYFLKSLRGSGGGAVSPAAVSSPRASPRSREPLAVSGVGAYFEVCAPAGLRIRDSPSDKGKEVGLLQNGQKILCTDLQGTWMRHAQGWSLILSDSKGERKVFLQPVD